MTNTIPDIPDDRKLPLAGAVNFRDLGGNVTTDSRLVKRGLVFRSDHLSRLSPDDHTILQRMQLKIVCDLRSIHEQQKAPDLLPDDSSIRLLSLPVQDRIVRPSHGHETLASWRRLLAFNGFFSRALSSVSR